MTIKDELNELMKLIKQPNSPLKSLRIIGLATQIAADAQDDSTFIPVDLFNDLNTEQRRGLLIMATVGVMVTVQEIEAKTKTA